MTTVCACGHSQRDHSAVPALDGRSGCLAAVGISRCACRRTAFPVTCQGTVYPRGGSQYDRLIGRECSKRAKFEVSHKVTPAVLHLCSVHVRTYDEHFWNIKEV